MHSIHLVDCSQDANGYISRLSKLTLGLPPTVLALNGQGPSVITTKI